MEYHDMQCRTPTPSNRGIRLRCNTASPEDRSVRKHASPEDRGNSESGDRRRGLRSRFKMLQTLGEGTYGKVRLAVERDTGIKYAIKTIRKNRISSSSDLIRIRREIEIMSRLGHPHIISVHQVYENKDKIVLVMEYASGGELYEYINQRTSNNNAKPTAVGGSGTTGGGADVQSGNSTTSRTTSKTTDGLPDHEARKFFRQIVSAVYYLHQNGIVHRDLKLENIFIDCRGYAKIGDFGLANLYEEGSCLRTFCGSPLYASPEIVNGRPYVGPEADCWSLGVLLYTLVYGAMPFDGSDFHRLRSQISEGKYYQPACKSEASDLIRQLLTVDVSMRATPEAAATHWWTNLGYSGTPIDNYSCLGRPVDYHSLKEIVRVDDPVNGNTSIDGPSGDNIDNGNVMSDDALDCQDHKPRGILKKYKNHVDNDTSLHHAVSPMNSCYSRSPTPSNRASPVIVPSTHVSGDDNLPKHHNHDNVYKQQQRTHLAVPSTKHVYDSQRKPRKGILKNMDFLDKAAEDTRARMINNGNDVNMISIVANGNYLRSDESDFYDYFSKQPSPRQGSPYNLTPTMGDHHFDRSRQSPSLDRSPYHSPVPSQQSSLLTQEQQELLTLYAPDYLNYATHTSMLQAHSGGISYDSGISEPNSMSRLEDVHGSAWTTSVHESSSSGKQGKDKWDHERTDSQESNMSVGSSLWGGSSHSSGVIISNNDSEDSLSSSQASTVTYPAARNHQLYDLNALKASLPDDEEEFNQCIAANRAINRLVNRSLDSDEVFKESKHNHYAVVPEYKRAAISRDIDVMVSARLSLSNSSVEHRAVEPSLGNGDSYAEDVASKRLSYGSTASSHASSVDTSIRSKDDVRNSLAFDEEDDFAGVDSLHRSPPAAPPTQHHGIMVNLLQEQIV